MPKGPQLQRATSSFNPGQVSAELGGDDRTVSFQPRPSQIGGLEKPLTDNLSEIERRLASLKEAAASLAQTVDGTRASRASRCSASLDSSFRASRDSKGDPTPVVKILGDRFFDPMHHVKTEGDEGNGSDPMPPPPAFLTRAGTSFRRAKNLSCLDK